MPKYFLEIFETQDEIKSLKNQIETNTLKEAQDLKLATTLLQDESVSVNDSLTRKLDAIRTLEEGSTSDMFDSVFFGDSTQFDVSGSLIDISDSLLSSKGNTRTLTESAININDSLNRLLGAIRTLSETVSVSDTLIRIGEFTRTFSESISVSDSLSRLGILPEQKMGIIIANHVGTG